jgi:WD40-like Beta Propeller Repeat
VIGFTPRRGALGIAAIAAGALSLGLTATGASADSCPNAQFRTGPSANLPDCRAYEQASPVDKNGFDVGLVETIQGGDNGGRLPVTPASIAAADGSGIAYESYGALPGAEASLLFNFSLGRRSASGWTTQVLPPSQSALPTPDFSSFVFFTPNLWEAVVRTPPGPSHAPGDTVGGRNIYLRINVDGTYRTLSVVPPVLVEPSAAAYKFGGASADLRHVLIGSTDALTPDAPVGAAQDQLPNLYEWVDGQLRLVTILPDGTPAPRGGEAGGADLPSLTAMSEDGSRIVFATPSEAPDGGQLYLREDGQNTVQVSASQRSTPDPSGPGSEVFWGASVDGSQIFFSSNEALTDDATLGVVSLYRYDVDSGSLTNLTVDANPDDPPNAGLNGGVMGVLAISGDGSQAYFQSTRQYIPGEGVSGQWNLYRWHDGTVDFVAADEATDLFDPFEGKHKTARITPDGEHFVFMSKRPLTGYDNTDAATGQPDYEVFLYDGSAEKLTCVSCNPSGRRPLGHSTLTEPPERTGAANLQRGISDDGRRVFFDSYDALVPEDVNGRNDVYEYEDGAVHLISTGLSGDDSYFADASKTGGDVFFITRERLAPTDVDDNLDVYDARVGGGFASVTSQPCSGDRCQGPSTAAPSAVVPGTTSVLGDRASQDATRPRASFRIGALSKAARRRAARTGYVRLAVRVSRGGTLKARVSRTVGGRLKTVASARRHAARGGTVRLRLRLDRATRAALARGVKVRLSVRVSLSHVRSSKTMTLELQR